MPSESQAVDNDAFQATQDKGTSATAPRQEPGGWSARPTLGRRTQREEGANADGQERPAKRAPIAAASSSDSDDAQTRSSSSSANESGYVSASSSGQLQPTQDESTGATAPRQEPGGRSAKRAPITAALGSDGDSSETSSSSSSANESGYAGSVGTFGSSDSSSGASLSSASSRSSNPSIPSIDSQEHRGMMYVADIAYEDAAIALDQANHPELGEETESSVASSARSQGTFDLEELLGVAAPEIVLGIEPEVPPSPQYSYGSGASHDFPPPMENWDLDIPPSPQYHGSQQSSDVESQSGSSAGQNAAAQGAVIEISDDSSSAGSGSGNAYPGSAIESNRTAHAEGSVDPYQVRAAEIAASADTFLQAGNFAHETSRYEASQGEVINISDDSSSSRSSRAVQTAGRVDSGPENLNSQATSSRRGVIEISDDTSSSRSAASNNRSARAASSSSESVQVVSERQGNRASGSDHGLDNRTREARGR